MKVIVAGSRNFDNKAFIFDVLNKTPYITEVVCGCAIGPDSIGEEWADLNEIPVKHFPADWKKFNNAAGPIRNEQMAQYGDVLIAFWDGISRGTNDMIRRAKKHKIPVYIIYPHCSEEW